MILQTIRNIHNIVKKLYFKFCNFIMLLTGGVVVNFHGCTITPSIPATTQKALKLV